MYEVFTDKRGKYRWRFLDQNNKKNLFRSSESYERIEDCIHCIRRARGSSDTPVINKVTGEPIVMEKTFTL